MTDMYDVFGATKSHTGASANVWKFTGELNDTSVARSPYYLRARYYDPATGRFLSREQWPANPVNPQKPKGRAAACRDAHHGKMVIATVAVTGWLSGTRYALKDSR